MRKSLTFNAYYQDKPAMFIAVVPRDNAFGKESEDAVWTKISRLRNTTPCLFHCGVDVIWF